MASLIYLSFSLTNPPPISVFLPCTENRLQEALACAQSYLLFHEGDEFMTDNVEYYQEELGHSVGPREVRVSQIQQQSTLPERMKMSLPLTSLPPSCWKLT